MLKYSISQPSWNLFQVKIDEDINKNISKDVIAEIWSNVTGSINEPVRNTLYNHIQHTMTGNTSHPLI